MAEAATVLGIASFGIQVCQGLISYLNRWKNYDSDIGSARTSVVELNGTLELLRISLCEEELDEERRKQVEKCLKSCKDGVEELSQKCQKFQQYEEPEGLREKLRSKLDKSKYALQKDALQDAKAAVDHVRDNLQLAVQILHLDVSAGIRRMLISTQQSVQFQGMKKWLSPPDPGTNHASARQRHEPQTSTWLLHSNQYQKWKSGRGGILWIHGKPGCGKTILCSSAIEDIREYCAKKPISGHAMFYFTFSDNQKQSYDNLVKSLIVQLVWKEPGLSMLAELEQKSKHITPSIKDLEDILTSSIRSLDEVFVFLDALDECPESDDTRRNVLHGLERLSQEASNLKVFVTSREVSDIRDSIEDIGASKISIDTGSVDTDIHKWVSNQLSSDRKLRQLSSSTKVSIEQTISGKADGMFRWAYCQLQELKKLKAFKPKYVDHALRNLPATLDDTYERMLLSIDEMYREEALKLLRWLAYAQSPPRLSELAEAAIIDPSGEGFVDVENRGPLSDTLEILGALITVQQPWGAEIDESVGREAEENAGTADDTLHSGNAGIGYNSVNEEQIEENSKSEECDDKNHDAASNAPAETLPVCSDDRAVVLEPNSRIEATSRIRLAHFSVQEFLESKRIVEGKAKMFHLNSRLGHKFLLQSCLTYLRYYSQMKDKVPAGGYFNTFPLLEYAAALWAYHSLLKQDDDVRAEISFLTSKHAKREWLAISLPDNPFNAYPYISATEEEGSALYYAAWFGLVYIAQEVLTAGADVNAQGGHYGNPLQVAAYRSNRELVKMFLDAGADVNAKGGFYGSALGAASSGYDGEIVRILLDSGANVNDPGGHFASPLHALISDGGSEHIMKILLAAGADFNADTGSYGTLIVEAVFLGRMEVVTWLIDAGADVNNGAGLFGTALQTASVQENKEMVEVLLKAGADVNAHVGARGTALDVAVNEVREEVVKLLIDAGADVNVRGTLEGSPLQIAAYQGSVKVVRMLLDAGADVKAPPGPLGTALQAALREKEWDVVDMLKAAGASLWGAGRTALKRRYTFPGDISNKVSHNVVLDSDGQNMKDVRGGVDTGHREDGLVISRRGSF